MSATSIPRYHDNDTFICEFVQYINAMMTPLQYDLMIIGVASEH